MTDSSSSSFLGAAKFDGDVSSSKTTKDTNHTKLLTATCRAEASAKAEERKERKGGARLLTSRFNSQLLAATKHSDGGSTINWRGIKSWVNRILRFQAIKNLQTT